jgi:hypothetical protein
VGDGGGVRFTNPPFRRILKNPTVRRVTMKRLLTGAVAFFSAMVLAGCLATVKHETASGRPEVTIPGKSAKEVLAFVSNDLINNGYNIRTRSELNAIFEKKFTGTGAFLISGPGLADPVNRLVLDFVESSGATRVISSYSLVSNPGGQKGVAEKVTSADDLPESKEIQTLLNSIRDRMK